MIRRSRIELFCRLQETGIVHNVEGLAARCSRQVRENPTIVLDC